MFTGAFGVCVENLKLTVYVCLLRKDQEIPEEATVEGLVESGQYEQGGLRAPVLQCDERRRGR